MDLKDIEDWGRELLQSEARKRGVKNPEMYSRGTLVRMILKQDYGAPKNVREAARLIGGMWGSAKSVLRAHLGSGAGVRTFAGAARDAERGRIGASERDRAPGRDGALGRAAAAAARGRSDGAAAAAARGRSDGAAAAARALDAQDASAGRAAKAGRGDADTSAEARERERVRSDADAARGADRGHFDGSADHDATRRFADADASAQRRDDARDAGGRRGAVQGEPEAEVGALRDAAHVGSEPPETGGGDEQGAGHARPAAEEGRLRDAATVRSELRDVGAWRDADRGAGHARSGAEVGAERDAPQVRSESRDTDGGDSDRGAGQAKEDAPRDAATLRSDSRDADAWRDAGHDAVHARPEAEEDAPRDAATLRSDSRDADAWRDAGRDAVHARPQAEEDALREAARVRSESRDARRDSERVRADSRAAGAVPAAKRVPQEAGWHEVPLAGARLPRASGESGASDLDVGRDGAQPSAADAAVSRGVDRSPSSDESGVRRAADELKPAGEDAESTRAAETQTPHLRLVESPADVVAQSGISSRTATLVPEPAFSAPNSPEAPWMATPFASAGAASGERFPDSNPAGASQSAAQHLTYGPHPHDGLLVRWHVTPDAIERARKVLGTKGELAVRIVVVRVNLHAVVKTDIVDHGPVAAVGDWTAPLLPGEARYVSAVGLRSPMRFVSIVHAAS